MKYNLSKGLLKTVKALALFAIPVLIDAFIYQYPAIAQLTIGGLLTFAWNYLKVKGIPIFRSI